MNLKKEYKLYFRRVILTLQLSTSCDVKFLSSLTEVYIIDYGNVVEGDT